MLQLAILVCCSWRAAAQSFHHGYPLDNQRAIYRESADLYALLWPAPQLLDGGRSSVGQSSDVALHPKGWKTEGPWTLVDFVYPFRLEREFDVSFLARTLRQWWWAGPAASVLYLAALRLGQKWMESQKPFQLKRALASWNLLLAMFSFCGAIRTVPHLFLLWREFGFEYTVCRAAIVSFGGSGAVALWICLFIFSKYVELLDTMFLVLRKKKVPFLHWYHHCTVLLYCWHSYLNEVPSGIHFAAMNYTVHAVMYFYYFLAAILPSPPRWATFVTILQLMQMVLGIYVTVYSVRTLAEGVPNCDGYPRNLAAAGVMYASYFALFAHFFAQRYCLRRKNDARSMKTE